MTDPSYVPFGEQWASEVQKLRKADIVDLYRQSSIARLAAMDNQPWVQAPTSPGWWVAWDGRTASCHHVLNLPGPSDVQDTWATWTKIDPPHP